MAYICFLQVSIIPPKSLTEVTSEMCDEYSEEPLNMIEKSSIHHANQNMRSKKGRAVQHHVSAKGSHRGLMKPLPIIRHHANFSMELWRGRAVQLQISTNSHQGLMKPMIALMNVTPKLDICVEHAKNAIACFADVATKMTRKSYESVLQVRYNTICN